MKMFTKKEEQVLLAVCHLENNACLVTIQEQIRKFTGKKFSVGTIYAPLNRLFVYGYLELYKEKPDTTKISKSVQYYKLTVLAQRHRSGLGERWL